MIGNTDTELIKEMNEEEIKGYINFLFNTYNKRKKDEILYKENDEFPKIIIKLYYEAIERIGMEKIFDSFKNNYLNIDEKGIDNENKLEEVHTKEERLGLYEVYNSIQEDKIPLEQIGIYSLSMLHQKLYSLAPHPEYSGSFRTDPARLKNAAIELYPPESIPSAVNNLNQTVYKIVSDSKEIIERNDYSKILTYIDNCVKLHCKLIEIHPFRDGNGRTTRALMNALFKLAGIPPVYVKPEEKKEYHQAMENAIVNNNYNEIFTFFRYKICDSIIALDLSMQKEKTI